MDIFLLVVLATLSCFTLVLFYGAPYLPTHTPQTKIALELLELKPGQYLYELGCGDGKVLIQAAKLDYKAVGYELNPLLYIFAKIRSFKYRKNITVKYGNFWKSDVSNADAVYVFLLDKFMARLDKKLKNELRSGTKLASYTFKIPGKTVLKEQGGVFLYEY